MATLSCRHKHVTDVKLDSTVVYLNRIATVVMGTIQVIPEESNCTMQHDQTYWQVYIFGDRLESGSYLESQSMVPQTGTNTKLLLA